MAAKPSSPRIKPSSPKITFEVAKVHTGQGGVRTVTLPKPNLGRLFKKGL